MDIKKFNYELPNDLIAQSATKVRDMSRLMVLDPVNKSIEHKIFKDIVDYLDDNDVLVLNKTKVIPARLIGQKEQTNAKIECFLLKRLSLTKWEVLLKPAKRLKIGQKVIFSDNLSAELIEILDNGNRIVEFFFEGHFEEELDKIANMPLPPYIKQELKDKNRYQTVYAKEGESVAAPTAGLHFTNELLQKLEQKGVEILEVYLTVGLGTFRPVSVSNIKDHIMHKEEYIIPEHTSNRINKLKKEGKRIVSVGTTTLRALESSVENGLLVSAHSETDIFIYGDYNFQIVDALITNFHLPQSTLLMLVSSFAGLDFTLYAYNIAVNEKYRFFSFGDSMFITHKRR